MQVVPTGAWPGLLRGAYFSAAPYAKRSSTREVASVRDLVIGFLQTIFFLFIVFVVLFGVMLFTNYLAAPAT
jgi:hypothetical protein